MPPARLEPRCSLREFFVSHSLYFEDLKIGDQWTTRARTVTQADIVNFAGITGDYDPLHVDHEFASGALCHQPIAHGLLGMSWVAGLASQCPAVNTMAFVAVREWNFLEPMLIGDTVHAVVEVAGKSEGNRRAGRIEWRRRLVNQRGQIVQEGIFETLVVKIQQTPANKQTPS